MDFNEFVSNFAALFDETEASVFTPNTEFKMLDDWSSLMALSIIAMVDEEYEVTLKGVDIKESETVQDLFDRVSVKMEK